MTGDLPDESDESEYLSKAGRAHGQQHWVTVME